MEPTRGSPLRRALLILLRVGIVVAIVVAVVLVTRAVLDRQYEASRASATLLRNFVAEIVVTKARGDQAILAGQPITAARSHAQEVVRSLAGVTVPAEMAGYLQAVRTRAADLAAANTPEAWQRVPPQPPPFALTMSARHATTELRAAIVEIDALRRASASAIARNDADGLLYVGGHLQALDHWLQAVEASSSPIEPLLAIGAAPGVRAERAAPAAGIRLPIPWPWPDPRRGTHCDPFPCIPQLRQKLPPIYSKVMPQGPRYEPAKIGETFGTAWDDIPPPEADTILSGAGISSVEPTELSWGQPVDAFIASCEGSGGTFNPGSAVRVGMPTSEGGHHCQFPNGCWNFLTYSGQFFRGGPSLCPHLGTIPPAPAPQPTTGSAPAPTKTGTAAPTPAPTSWDGVYALSTWKQAECDLQGGVTIRNGAIYFPPELGVPPTPLPALNNTEVVVRGNRVQGVGNGLAIDASGRAADRSTSGVVVSYQFARTAAGATVTNSVTISIPGANCAFAASGSRR